MKIRVVIIMLTGLFSSLVTVAQISHGGTPLYKNHPQLRNSEVSEFVEMPALDLDSILRADKIQEENTMRGSFQFAHKFYTHIEQGKDGNTFVLPDGTKVWQVGIRSKGAYSINLLFTEFHIPEGAKLFIYNTDQSHVIGSFDHRNNSRDRILPVRPVSGEAIIVEYSEPATVSFEGKLVIGEVNHDYRGILRREPDASNSNSFLCMPNVLCGEVDESMIRSSVLLMINGTSSCTGSLLNNTENDETPYLLTAVHCLNSQLVNGVYQDRDHYTSIAGTIVAFFNYNRPVCETVMKATEEMSLARAYPRAILEKKDIALLEFQDKPPVYYNAYYAGWNVTDPKQRPPYTNIHHPGGDVKRYGIFSNNLSSDVSFYPNGQAVFDERSHFMVSSWNTGSTHAGSSGSPLFDKDHLIVGGLSGGESTCNGSNPNGKGDAFFGLYKGWLNSDDESNQLSTYLAPNKEIHLLEGLDPNKDHPVVRISNARYNEGDRLITTQYPNPEDGFLFGSNRLNVTEFAEEFDLKYSSEIYGVYLLVPPIPYTSNVEIQVYDGLLAPEKRIATQQFNPQFLNYESGFTNKNKEMNRVATENFVLFDKPVPVNKKFFIAYNIAQQTGNSFVIYNTSFGSSGIPNTAWIKEQDSWKRANEFTPNPLSTSLAMHPLLKYTDTTDYPPVETSNRLKISYLREERKLFLPGKPSESGQVTIYDVSGRLLQAFPIRKDQQAVELSTQSPGRIGIARIVRGNDVYTGKFIY